MILDFGKYSLEILFSYLSTFSLILILVILIYSSLNIRGNKESN